MIEFQGFIPAQRKKDDEIKEGTFFVNVESGKPYLYFRVRGGTVCVDPDAPVFQKTGIEFCGYFDAEVEIKVINNPES